MLRKLIHGSNRSVAFIIPLLHRQEPFCRCAYLVVYSPQINKGWFSLYDFDISFGALTAHFIYGSYDILKQTRPCQFYVKERKTNKKSMRLFVFLGNGRLLLYLELLS